MIWWPPKQRRRQSVQRAVPHVYGDTRPAGKPGAPRIVNIVNFIRGVEPRAEMDLLEPVAQQIRLVHEYGLPATFLIQYDVLTQPRFVDLLKRERDDRDETPARWSEREATKVLNTSIKKYTRRRPYLKYVETWDMVLNPDGQPLRHLFAPDQLHFRPEGYRLLANRVRPFLAK